MKDAISMYLLYRRAGNSIAVSIKAGLAAWRKT